jgi:hypothetical protein
MLRENPEKTIWQQVLRQQKTLAVHVFSFWRLVSFLPGFFPEHVFPGYKFVSCSLVFVEARAPILVR